MHNLSGPASGSAKWGSQCPPRPPRPVSRQEAIKRPGEFGDGASPGGRNRHRSSQTARRHPRRARPRPRRPGGGYVTSEPASGRLRAPEPRPGPPRRALTAEPRPRRPADPWARPSAHLAPTVAAAGSSAERAARSEQRVTAAQPAFAAAATADSPLSHSGKRDRARCARPRRPPLAAASFHLHTRGAGLRGQHTHWPRCPSLSLHKTHMELHVHRVGSSMKTRRSLAPPPRPPEWSLPLPASVSSIQDSSRPQLGGARSGAYHRGTGGGNRLLLSFQPAGRRALAEVQAPRGHHLQRRTRGVSPAAARNSLRTSFIHTFAFIDSHSFAARCWSSSGEDQAQAVLPELPEHAHPGHLDPRSCKTANFQEAFLSF